MNQKKSNKLLVVIIIVVAIIIILLGIIATLYFTTDLMRGNKELFLKYGTQLFEKEEGFISQELDQYFEKKRNTPYENKGDFSTTVTATSNQKEYDALNDFNVTFKGQVDTANDKAMQDIQLNYSNEVNFPLTYKKTGNIVGLQTKYVGKNFIAIDIDQSTQNNSEETFGANGNGLNTINQINQLKNIELTEDDKKHMKDTYVNVLNQQLQENDFSKIKTSDTNGYQLTLTGEKLQNILIQMLQTLQTDQITLGKLNEYLAVQKETAKITSNDIDEYIQEISNQKELSNQNIKITIYEKDRKLNKIDIELNEGKIVIEKLATGNEIQYRLSSESEENGQPILFSINAKYSGLQSLQSITENYQVNIEKTGNIAYLYEFNNLVNFIPVTNIEELTNKNAAILNKQEPEQVANLIMAITERITKVNQQQMETLGLEENPIAKMLPTSIFTKNMANNSELFNINTDEELIAEYNENLELYAGTNIQGTTIKGLLTTIATKNEMETEDSSYEGLKVTEINYLGEELEANVQNLNFVKSEIDTQKAYKVEFEKDSNTGIIYRVIINER